MSSPVLTERGWVGGSRENRKPLPGAVSDGVLTPTESMSPVCGQAGGQAGTTGQAGLSASCSPPALLRSCL